MAPPPTNDSIVYFPAIVRPTRSVLDMALPAVPRVAGALAEAGGGVRDDVDLQEPERREERIDVGRRQARGRQADGEILYERIEIVLPYPEAVVRRLHVTAVGAVRVDVIQDARAVGHHGELLHEAAGEVLPVVRGERGEERRDAAVLIEPAHEIRD